MIFFQVKYCKATSSNIYSNLKSHLKTSHQTIPMKPFQELIDANRIRQKRNRTEMDIEEMMEGSPKAAKKSRYYSTGTDASMMEIKMINPWSVESINEFSYFCCPECDSKWKAKQEFVNHAFDSHPQGWP